jgi:hypothetical protein
MSIEGCKHKSAELYWLLLGLDKPAQLDDI